MSAAVLSSTREKRPLEANSDEETENEDQSGSKGTEKDKEAVIEADELLVKKKVKHAKPFTEDLLTLPDGLQRIYEEFPVACKFRGRGSEAKDIKKLMTMYREWAFQLHPGLAPSDVIAKCETLGAKGKTRSCIQNLRDRERSRYIIEVLEVSQRQSESPLFHGTTTATTNTTIVPPSTDMTKAVTSSLSPEDSFTSPEGF